MKKFLYSFLTLGLLATIFSCDHSIDDNFEVATPVTDNSTSEDTSTTTNNNIDNHEPTDITAFKQKFIPKYYFYCYATESDPDKYYQIDQNGTDYYFLEDDKVSFFEHKAGIAVSNGSFFEFPGELHTYGCIYKEYKGTTIAIYNFIKDNKVYKDKDGYTHFSYENDFWVRDGYTFHSYSCSYQALRARKYNDEYIIIDIAYFRYDYESTSPLDSINDVTIDDFIASYSYLCKVEDFINLTFNANGGNINDQNSQKIGHNILTKLYSSESMGVTRDGYYFKGWAKTADSKEVEYKDAAKVSFAEDTTLYAIWAYDASYKITLKLGGNSGFTSQTISGQTIDGKVTGKVTTSKYSNDNFVFMGWSTLPSNAYSLNVEPPYSTKVEYTSGQEITLSEDITLYAVWGLLKTYTITFNANEGSISTETQISNTKNVVVGTETGEITSTLKTASAIGLTRSGFRFRGWALSPEATDVQFTDGASITIGGDTTLYALWDREITYTITYDGNGGYISVGTENITGTVLTGVTAKIKSRNEISTSRQCDSGGYYILKGWSRSSSATSATYTCGETITLTGNITLYAVWYLPTYSGSFTSNGRTIGSYSVTGYEAPLILPPPETRSGYTFTGWKNGDALYQSGARVYITGNATFTAQWVENCFYVRLYHPGYTSASGQKYYIWALAIGNISQADTFADRNGYKYSSYIKVPGTSGSYSWATTFSYKKGNSITTVNQTDTDYFTIGKYYTINVTTGSISSN